MLIINVCAENSHQLRCFAFLLTNTLVPQPYTMKSGFPRGRQSRSRPTRVFTNTDKGTHLHDHVTTRVFRHGGELPNQLLEGRSASAIHHPAWEKQIGFRADWHWEDSSGKGFCVNRKGCGWKKIENNTGIDLMRCLSCSLSGVQESLVATTATPCLTASRGRTAKTNWSEVVKEKRDSFGCSNSTAVREVTIVRQQSE